MTGGDSAPLECHPDGRGIRLVCRRVGGADEASEVAAPAQTFGFAPQHRPSLVADHAEIESCSLEMLEQLGCPGQSGQPLEMDGQEGIEIDLPCLFPPRAAQSPRRHST